MTGTVSDERRPLLGTTPSLKDSDAIDSKKWRPTTIAILIVLIAATANLADGMASTPLTRTYESIVCYKYWAEHDPSKLLLSWDEVGPGAVGGIAEEWCKVAPVQAEVALVKGWQIFFDGIPGLLLGVPLGAAADYYGRRPVIIIGLLGLSSRVAWMEIVCFFWKVLPLRLAWISALNGLVSGGAPVVSAIVLCVVSDITSAKNRVGLLLQVAAASMIMNYGGPALGAIVMKVAGMWPALILALALWLFSFLQACFLPETLNYSHPSLEHPPIRPEIHQDPPVDRTDEHIAEPASHSLRGTAARISSIIRSNSAFLLSDSRIPLLIFPYIPMMFTEVIREMLVLYASVRYSMTIADATFWTLGGAFSKCLALLFIMPLCAKALDKYVPSLKPLSRDLFLTRLTLALLCVGWILTGLAPTAGLFAVAVVVAALGAGANSLCRSFLTEIVGRQKSGKLYTIISVVESLAIMSGGPIISYLWRAALDVGGGLIGLPFYFIGVVYGLGVLATLLVRVRKGDPGFEEYNGDEAVSGDDSA